MEKYSLNKVYHGFLLVEVQEMPEVHGEGYLFSHVKSGARLFYIKSEDENKVFSISFKTPPQDDCGTSHILEHSVLCGSRKYQAKDPFNELAKGSLNTFLNALTYADKTMYPVASCNEEDFHNLMDVYLDAVFYPNIYEKKEIFMQEGWRYVLQEEELDISGVVYNEMKGALSDPESLLSDALARGLFGKTTYGFESGGDPEAIPSLTYDAFLDFHRTYYHPSNAYLYLYGNLDLERCLQHLNDAYLLDFEKSDVLPVIEEAAPFAEVKYIAESYPAEEGSSLETGYLAYTVKAGLCTNEELVLAMQILSYVLLETNASPLKIALQESGICSETEGWFDSSTYEMSFSIVAKEADFSKHKEFPNLIEETLKKLVENGMNRILLESSLRRMEFLLREEDYGSMPKGLIYGMRLMKSWLHGKSPYTSLHMLTTLNKLKDPEYDWCGLISEILLHNKNKVILSFAPEIGKREREETAFCDKMKAIKNEFTTEELASVIAEASALKEFQEKEDDTKTLEQIPQLKLSQIDKKAKFPIYSIEKIGEREMLFLPLKSNGILYFRLHFNTDVVPLELLPYTGVITELAGKLATKNHSFQELPMEINQLFGGFHLENTIYSKDSENYQSFVTVKAKVLKEDLQDALALLDEILLVTNFDDLENLKKTIRTAKINEENYAQNSPHLEAIHYSMSNLSKGSKVNEITSGITYLHFLSKLEKEMEQNPSEVISKLKEVAKLLFTEKNLFVSLGCEEENKGNFVEQLGKHLERYPKAAYSINHYPFVLSAETTAFTSTSAVQYNVLTANYGKGGFAYHGSMQVLKTILSLEHLWNKIRVQGGAYGCGSQFQENGLCFFYSYRDPKLAETFQTYRELWQDLKSFCAGEREMTKYILGTINRLDQPKSNSEMLNWAIQANFKGMTEESAQLERYQILETTDADIRRFADMLQFIAESENICTVGGVQKIDNEKRLFQIVKQLII